MTSVARSTGAAGRPARLRRRRRRPDAAPERRVLAGPGVLRELQRRLHQMIQLVHACTAANKHFDRVETADLCRHHQ